MTTNSGSCASRRKGHGRTLVAGHARGAALTLTQPLSFWGGMEIATGRIIDQHHPQVGRCLTDCILFMPAGRGSSSSSSVLAEAIYAGSAPAAIVLNAIDVVVALGAMVAKELYASNCPVVVLPEPFVVAAGLQVTVEARQQAATVTVHP